ncbi:MAG: hypothetical protein B7Y93_00320 [Micrococcales bacterium 32-70-13]|nr:MAG: hypothetical protein B7Y93_00320 [Micrococcales bacterium 32-70-13]
MTTTILLPLHRSRPWLDSLLDQVRALSGHVALVVSDATEHDDTLAVLRRELGDDPALEWRARRPLAPGWRAHANDLLAGVSTPYVMWLSHDDRIGPDWVAQAEALLDERSELVAVCGPIRALRDEHDSPDHLVEVPSFVELADPRERVGAALRSLLVDRPADLGVLYRSVVRTAAMPPLPPGVEGDEFSDVLWGLSLLEAGPVGRTEAVYEKRWHSASAHAQWPAWSARSTSIRQRLIDALPSADRQIVVDAWTFDVSVWNAAIETARAEERAAAVTALEALRAEFEGSRSWRLTAPLRRLRPR